jgi:hypothetical protein
MEKHFLNDFVSGQSGFRAEPWYNPYGDCIVYQTQNEAVVADRIDSLLTVYRSASDNTPIGFQIKGVRALLEKFGLDAVAIMSEETAGKIQRISVALLLLMAFKYGDVTREMLQAYADVISSSKVETEISPSLV